MVIVCFFTVIFAIPCYTHRFFLALLCRNNIIHLSLNKQKIIVFLEKVEKITLINIIDLGDALVLV